ncbi:MAG: T9SS type A sorting domain-containing protein, partial [Bacteroidales bacterium]|nr:T9SS type A sorting domain-containing protein [Bacteroidales bacterium]
CSVTITEYPTATDHCAGLITATTTTPFPITEQGATVVTWVYDDGNGNVSMQTQNVMIDDVTAPIPGIANLPDITDEYSVTITEYPTATDNCAGLITATTTTPFPITEQGATVITWVYDDGNGNVSTQTQNVMISVGIDTYENLGIQIYPNPVNDVLNIKFNNEIANKIEIFDNTGRLIIVKTTINNPEKIDLSNLPKGIYFIHFQTNRRMISAKLIK